ncbi:uncharacterized protein EI90DRAFT_1991023 [Cantharellus anzutake]|uniref:uncharacterized protein n=1 Tax=Cantharellus anzutake TaxID=1750568 RepID=UPI001907CC2D|nr:uncharacterized protein EI90DRAFT_1991023 [Cantharellus anzutake]KAF8326058.1 hypothetical protein EI90DRAFT_1991023 [Cantharellus anzutake]
MDNRDKDKDKSGNGKAKMNKQVLFSTTSSVSRVPVAVGGVEDEGREKVVGVSGLRTYEHKAVVQIPEKKSASHWGVGSTMRTGTVCVKFVLSAKITFTSNRGSSEVVKLPEQEFVVASVDEAERQRVIAQWFH